MTANVSLKPPARFNVKFPDEWPKWKRHFQKYLTATGLDKEGQSISEHTVILSRGRK